MAIDYLSCLVKLYPTIEISDFELRDEGDGTVYFNYWNEVKLGTCPTIQMIETYALSAFKLKALATVKLIRQKGLDAIALSAGILAVYNTNYDASVDFLNGEPNAEIKIGVSCEEYLAEFGARLGMTAAQFANYIIAENIRMGPTLFQVESRYLALTYGGDAENGIIPINSMTSIAAIEAAVIAYADYCGVDPIEIL